MCTDTWLAGTSILSLRSTMYLDADPDDLPPLLPSWRLKAIPEAYGKGHDVLQLIDTFEHHNRRRGPPLSGDGVVQFQPSPTYNLTGLTPIEYMGTHYLEMNYTEGYASIVHDFLKD